MFFDTNLSFKNVFVFRSNCSIGSREANPSAKEFWRLTPGDNLEISRRVLTKTLNRFHNLNDQAFSVSFLNLKH